VGQPNENQRVLGNMWESSTDKFVFELKFDGVPAAILNCSRSPTKREVLKVAMSLFDPIGFLSPVTVSSRILLQKTWKAGINWDDELKNDLLDGWKEWMQLLARIVDVKVPRCYSKFLYQADDVQLHVFCDASAEAYSAVVYLRIENQGVHVAFVASKARVAPLKGLTIPKMELYKH
jgi:Pao retrotransposon peptidase